MECAICFHEVRKSKLLICGHYFCEECVESLAGGSLAMAQVAQQSSDPTNSFTPTKKESAKSTAGSGTQGEGTEPETKAGESDTERKEKSDDQAQPSAPPLSIPNQTKIGIECPKCRRFTTIHPQKGVGALRSKFFGNLGCCQCDEEKPVGEFRWCHDCLVSTCSTCFVDKHAHYFPDGTMSLHTASKWEDYHSVEFCLGQLKLEAKNSEKLVDNAKEYVQSYMNGLKEFMEAELESKAENFTGDVAAGGKRLAEEFGISWEKIRVAKDPNHTYQYLLPSLKRLTGLTQTVNSLQNIESGWDLNVRSIPYKEISKHLLSSQKKPFEPKFMNPKVFREKSKETFVLGANLIKEPCEICLLDGNTLLISDAPNGIFLFRTPQNTLIGPLPLKKRSYHEFSKICKVPGNRNRVMITVRYEHWGYIVLQLPDNLDKVATHFEQISLKGHHHWALPHQENVHLGASDSALFALSGNDLYKFNGIDGLDNEPSWSRVYRVAQGNPRQYTRLGPVIEKELCSQVLVVNTQWKSVDVISVGHGDSGIWGVRRIEIPTIDNFIFMDPIIDVIDAEEKGFLLADRALTGLYFWSMGSGSMVELTKFTSKAPYQMAISTSTRTVFFIMHDGDITKKLRCLEMIRY